MTNVTLEQKPGGGTFGSLVFALPLLAFVAAGLWLLWTMADGVLGRQWANLVVFALLVGTFCASRLTSRRGAGMLARAAGLGLAAPIGVALGVLGYMLASGG